MTRIVNFEIVRVAEPDRPAVLIYALGENGVLYEMAGGRWVSLAIGDNVLTLEEAQAEAAQRAARAAQSQIPPGRTIRPKGNSNDASERN